MNHVIYLIRMKIALFIPQLQQVQTICVGLNESDAKKNGRKKTNRVKAEEMCCNQECHFLKGSVIIVSFHCLAVIMMR